MGIFTGISNLADLPGSIVRDLIGGENPLDQLLNPFGDVDRLTTEEVTGQDGIIGLLLELGMDPLTYLGGAGVIKALPKIRKARRAAKGASGMKRTRALRQARGRAGGIKSGLTRRKKKVQKAIGESSAFGRDGDIPNWVDVLDDHNLVTEEMSRAMGHTLKGPKGPGILSRAKGGIAARGRGLKGRARHGWRQTRRLPGSTQAILAGKVSPAWLEKMFDDNPELRNILQEQSGVTNEPLNMASPMELLQRNLPGPEYYAPTDPMVNLSGPDPASGSYELPYYMPRVSAPDDLGY